MLNRLGVLGWPVAHSRSPAMHNAALQSLGLHDTWRYSLLPAHPDQFAEIVRALPGAGFRGANVTIPHKAAARAIADSLTEAAQEIGATNTLRFAADGTIEADNTDAPGMLAALPFDPRGATALVLGAGGTARAAVWALRNAGAARVWVWNRTPERARQLAEAFGADPVGTEQVAALRRAGVDLLVQTTSLGLDGDDTALKALPLSVDEVEEFRCVIDFVYRATVTPYVAAARRRGVPAVDGPELLVQQGALSFTRFTGHPAPLEIMRAAVRGA